MDPSGGTASRLSKIFWGAAPAPSTAREPDVVVRHALRCLQAFDAASVVNEETGAPFTLMELLADLGIEEDLVYASPELVRGETLDERSLVFTIGVLIFERLTDRHPFGTTEAGRLARLRRGEMGSGVNYFPSVPKELRTILIRAMGPFPEERFSGLEALRTQLARFVREPELARQDSGSVEPRRRPRFLDATTPVRPTVIPPAAERSTPGVQRAVAGGKLRGPRLAALRSPRFFEAATVTHSPIAAPRQPPSVPAAPKQEAKSDAPAALRAQPSKSAEGSPTPAERPRGLARSGARAPHPPIDKLSTLEETELLEEDQPAERTAGIAPRPGGAALAADGSGFALGDAELAAGLAARDPLPDAVPPWLVPPTTKGARFSRRLAPMLYLALGAAVASGIFVLMRAGREQQARSDKRAAPPAKATKAHLGQETERHRVDARRSSVALPEPTAWTAPKPLSKARSDARSKPAPRAPSSIAAAQRPAGRLAAASSGAHPTPIAAGKRVAEAIRSCGLRPDGRALRVGVYLRASKKVLRAFILPLPWLKPAKTRCMKQRVTALTLPLDVSPETYVEWRIRLLAYRSEVRVLKPKELR